MNDHIAFDVRCPLCVCVYPQANRALNYKSTTSANVAAVSVSEIKKVYLLTEQA